MPHQDQPPWGKKKRPQTPEEIVAQLIKKLQNYFSDGKKKPPGGEEHQGPAGPKTHLPQLEKFLSLPLLVSLSGVFFNPSSKYHHRKLASF